MLVQEYVAMMVQVLTFLTPTFLIEWLPFGDLFNKSSQILSYGEAVKCGRFELTPFESEEDYLNELFILQSKVYSRSIITPHAKWSQLYKQLVNEVSSIRLTQQDGRLREQPFGILVYGPPGSGKSMTTVKLVKKMYNRLDLTLQARDVVTLNETDEFQSEYRSCHKVVVFDDVGQSSLTYEVSDYTRKLIDFINNIPKVALNPHLQMKGKVRIRPDVVIATTNRHTDDMQGNGEFTQPVICPDAVMRRFRLIVRAEADCKYDKFTIMKYTGSRNKNAGSSYFEDIKVVDFNGLLDYGVDVWKEHRLEQQNFTQMINEVFAEDDKPKTEGISFRDMFRVGRLPEFQAECMLSQSGETGWGKDSNNKSWSYTFGRILGIAGTVMKTNYDDLIIQKNREISRLNAENNKLSLKCVQLAEESHTWEKSYKYEYGRQGEYPKLVVKWRTQFYDINRKYEDLKRQVKQLEELNKTLEETIRAREQECDEDSLVYSESSCDIDNEGCPLPSIPLTGVREIEPSDSKLFSGIITRDWILDTMLERNSSKGKFWDNYRPSWVRKPRELKDFTKRVAFMKTSFLYEKGGVEKKFRLADIPTIHIAMYLSRNHLGLWLRKEEPNRRVTIKLPLDVPHCSKALDDLLAKVSYF